MTPIDVTLGLSPRILDGLADGTFVRDGGIIREVGTGRIAALLRDAQVQDSPLSSLVGANLVPLAVCGVAFGTIAHRIGRLEEGMRRLEGQLRDVGADVRLTSALASALLGGGLLGTLHAVHLDSMAGRTDLAQYRLPLLQAFHGYRRLCETLLATDEHIRGRPAEVLDAVMAMLLAGIAARDLSARMGETPAAEALSSDVLAASEGATRLLETHLRQPGALFWRGDEHAHLLVATRESTARLRAHLVAIQQLGVAELTGGGQLG